MPEIISGLLPGLYWLWVILYFEITLRLATVKSFKNFGFVSLFIWSALYACVLMLITPVSSGSVSAALTTALTLILFFLFASQLVYYKIFKMFYTLYSMGNAGQVLDFVKDIAAYVASCLQWILVLLLPPAAYFLFLADRLFSQGRLSQPGSAVTVTMITLTFAVLLLSIARYRLHAGRGALGSSYEAYHKSMDPTVTLRHFGLLTTMRLDFQRTILGMKSMIYDDQQMISALTAEDAGPWPPSKYNALPMVFSPTASKLKELAADPQLKDLHNWLSAQPPTPKNAYTGLFKGCNLIVLTAESMSPYSINETLTPTLYKMTHSGFHFTDFYNPIWGVSTSDGEYVACTSLLPKCGVWSFIESAGKSMAMTLGNQLRPLGYTTTAYHNHRYSYYKRHLSHPNMGYTYFGLGNGLNVTPTWPESDLEMMQLTVPQYIDKEPFHTYYMTVSGHMRYSFSGNAMASKNRAAVEHLNLSEEAKAYLATQVELDRAMASLLEQLEAAGVSDRTLIAMSADHYPYGLSDAALDELAGHKVDRSFELYRSPFILYCPGNKRCQTPGSNECLTPGSNECLTPGSNECLTPGSNECLTPVSNECQTPGSNECLTPGSNECLTPTSNECLSPTLNRCQTPVVINTPCSSLDILPTLCNLMGLEYDSRLFMGRDIFSDSEPLVMFLNKSFITRYGRYDALKKSFLPMVTEPTPIPTTDYIHEVTKTMEEKFLASARILDLDYYGYLDLTSKETR
ncbi:MAG: sulfatase-like hydrolase/transferase [Acidaminobacter sp.]|uniref:LTA synthase family protein n=1 Tax=Acidaminobacter sp. TaxID=1872102 RepID=UPI00137F85E9|nr:alkaline phosphatase family protein [Acidaminobacter sp.]MZQ98518.1 sulfatase-like hydrolase/transferase [Acidaminobacter sp.]